MAYANTSISLMFFIHAFRTHAYAIIFGQRDNPDPHCVHLRVKTLEICLLVRSLEGENKKDFVCYLQSLQ